MTIAYTYVRTNAKLSAQVMDWVSTSQQGKEVAGYQTAKTLLYKATMEPIYINLIVVHVYGLAFHTTPLLDVQKLVPYPYTSTQLSICIHTTTGTYVIKPSVICRKYYTYVCMYVCNVTVATQLLF